MGEGYEEMQRVCREAGDSGQAGEKGCERCSGQMAGKRLRARVWEP